MDPASPAAVLAAVVLAGGESRRFGSDKLDARLAGGSLLEHAVDGLPADAELLVVGPERALPRPARFVREFPPGGGPAAALVAGLSAALATAAHAIVVLPGDAPAAGAAATALEAVRREASAEAVVAEDTDGRLQPLQLALSRAAAEQLIRRAGPAAGRHASARGLVEALDPPPTRLTLGPGAAFDIDNLQQLRVYQASRGPAVGAVLAALDARAPDEATRVAVALDGPSGAGKTTLAAALALRRVATVVDADDFYAPDLPRLAGAERAALTDAEVGDRVIDWRRLRREALEPLLRGEPAPYRPYDWERDDGHLGPERVLRPARLLIVEGVYSARPELADLLDLTVLVTVDPGLRRARLESRHHDPPSWVRFWERGERSYFDRVRPPATFDVCVHSPGER